MTRQNTTQDGVFVDVVDGVLQLVDTSDANQPKTFVEFDGQTELFTIEFDFRIDTDEYATTLTSAFGQATITAAANEALRLTTTGDAGEQKFRYTDGSDNVTLDDTITVGDWYNIALTKISCSLTSA